MKKNISKQKPQKPKKEQVAKPNEAKGGMLDSLESYLQKRQTGILYVLLALSVLFGFLLFDAKISEGNDDSLYIEGGFNYATNFTGYYFTANAPLYPMFLSLLIRVFGLKLLVFKFFNIIFFVSHILLLYKALKDRMPMIVLVPALLITAVNSYFLYFASHTYTESLFVFLQAVFIAVFVKLMDKVNQDVAFKENIKGWVFLGVSLFILTFCKNIAVGAVGALALFFILEKKYLAAGLTVASFAAIKLPFEGLKKLVWGDYGQYGSQLQILMQKDPYNALKGNDDFWGFVQRFLDNFGIYISKRFYQILGFRSEDVTTTSTGLLILFLVLAVIGVIYIIRDKQKVLGFIALYTSSLAGLTFLVLQTRWDQPRFVMVYVPFMLMIIFYGLYSFLRKKGFFGQFSYVAVVLIFLLASSAVTFKKSAANIQVLSKNFSGDIFYGYSNDWVNYLRMSQWCGKNLPEGSYVACRKAPMSFVYGDGMKFYPVYAVPEVDPATNLSNPDSVLAILQREKVTHVILANLRRNPKKVDGYIINTMHRMMQPIAKKYPEKLTLVRQEGQAEPAYLYKINY